MNQQFPPYTPFFSKEERCKPGECGNGNRTNVFQGDLNATVWNILPLMNTTHAFINLGWESHFDLDEQYEFSCVMQDFERQYPNIQLFLISHPPPKETLKNETMPRFDPTKLKCKVKVLDRTILSKHVPEEWYFDNMHVWSVLNEEYNHQLMEKLCPL